MAYSLHPSITMRSRLRDLRRAPFYPLVPFVPLAIVSGMLALEVFVLARLRRLSRSVDELLEHRQGLAT